jgi:hypothetical protein
MPGKEPDGSIPGPPPPGKEPGGSIPGPPPPGNRRDVSHLSPAFSFLGLPDADVVGIAQPRDAARWHNPWSESVRQPPSC